MSKYLDENGLLYFWQKIMAKFVAKVEGKGLSSNDYTTAEKSKLAGIAENANNYSLPTATAETLGGVRVGAGLSITGGVLSATGGGTADAVEWSNVQNKPTTLAGYGITDAPKKVSDLTNDSGYQTQAQVTAAIGAAVASAVIYMGSVADMAALNAITGQQTGWMYNVETDGMNYVWNGSSWDAQAPTINIVSITNAEIDTIVAS